MFLENFIKRNFYNIQSVKGENFYYTTIIRSVNLKIQFIRNVFYNLKDAEIVKKKKRC